MSNKPIPNPKSKLFRLKEWLTVPDAARHLSIVFGEDVSEADVLRFALDNQLKLSVNFINHTYVKRGIIVGEDKAEWDEFPLSDHHKQRIKERFPEQAMLIDESKDMVCSYMISLNIDGERFINIDDKVTVIDGVWDLPMIGSEQLDIEHEYQMLTGGPEVTLTILDGTMVERADGQICQLQERITHVDSFHNNDKLSDFEKKIIAAGTIIEERLLEKKMERANRPYNHPDNFYPAGGLPSDSVLVVRAQALIDLQNRLSEEESEKNTMPLDPRSERTYLNIIGALLEVVTGTFKDDSFSSETQLRYFIAEKFDDLRGVSPRTLADKFALAKKALNGELD